jgi:hypothetical protein
MLWRSPIACWESAASHCWAHAHVQVHVSLRMHARVTLSARKRGLVILALEGAPAEKHQTSSESASVTWAHENLLSTDNFSVSR